MNSLQRLIDEWGILPLRPPVQEDDFKEFEAKAGFRLPPDIRALYSICNGVKFRSTRFYIMSFQEACHYWGLHKFFPFTENNDSDPFCVCCDEILYGYVVHMTHEREPHVKFRSLETFFEAAAVWLKSKHWDMRYIKPEIKGARRTSHDIETAHKLIEILPALGDYWDRVMYARFAMKLLSNQHVSEIAPFLEDESEYVSEDAYERLMEIRNQEAANALQHFDASMRQFMQDCVDHIKQAGFEPRVANFENFTIQIQSGFMGLNIPMFYTERHRPDFWEYFTKTVITSHEQQMETKEFPTKCEAYLKQFKLPPMAREGVRFLFWPISLDGKSVEVNLGPLFEERHRPDFWEDYLIEYVYRKINQAEGWE